MVSNNTSNQELIQLKLDYLSFMESVNKELGYDIGFTGVLFTLLMEDRYISQEEIENLTGLARSTISENLQELSKVTSKFPVSRTRKYQPNSSDADQEIDKRKIYYYIPFDFERYIRTLYLSTHETSEDYLEYVPEIVAQLNHLLNQKDLSTSEKNKIQYAKDRVFYLLLVSKYVEYIKEYSKSELPELFKQEQYEPSFLEEANIQEKKSELKNLLDKLNEKSQPHTKTFLEIKQKFVKRMQSYGADTGKQKDILGLFITLFLTPETLTQEDLQAQTGYSRATISEALSQLEDIHVVTVIKRSNDRKKYYQLNISMEQYSFSKFYRQKAIFQRIREMMYHRFIPHLEKIDCDEEQRQNLQHFFKENARLYKLLENYISYLFQYSQQAIMPTIKDLLPV